MFVSRDPVLRALCYFYFPPCGNITHFEPPAALCGSTCRYVIDSFCQEQWTNTVKFFDNYLYFLTEYNLGFLNCSNPSSELDAFPHCCSNAGIEEFIGINMIINAQHPGIMHSNVQLAHSKHGGIMHIACSRCRILIVDCGQRVHPGKRPRWS